MIGHCQGIRDKDYAFCSTILNSAISTHSPPRERGNLLDTNSTTRIRGIAVSQSRANSYLLASISYHKVFLHSRRSLNFWVGFSPTSRRYLDLLCVNFGRMAESEPEFVCSVPSRLGQELKSSPYHQHWTANGHNIYKLPFFLISSVCTYASSDQINPTALQKSTPTSNSVRPDANFAHIDPLGSLSPGCCHLWHRHDNWKGAPIVHIAS